MDGSWLTGKGCLSFQLVRRCAVILAATVLWTGTGHAQVIPGYLLGRILPRIKPAPAAPAKPDPVVTRFIQVHPRLTDTTNFQRSPDKWLAVVLIPGLQVHPFNKTSPDLALFRGWETTASTLVKGLGTEADVYAFAYSQNVAIEEIAGVPGLMMNIRRLKMLRYTDIVLLGHSAGGLVARQFVEDYPDAGVTKVIQVCAPNEGAVYAALTRSVPPDQRPFLHSLTREARAHFLKERANKRIPVAVEFVCVVGDGAGLGDGVISNHSQWPVDLQAQGIPAFPLRTTHFTVLRAQADVERLAELARIHISRWDIAQVAAARKILLVK